MHMLLQVGSAVDRHVQVLFCSQCSDGEINCGFYVCLS